ncbi:META domain-containing protein [Shewanella avicenniae]|uniref:META domain-containing protein n=1 Tax=Shewanella avicenniae TaxID=2814294 RepID=A0ABX7QSB6_9GAMM|nr:META domain-containing protein [Shewanella avicenniae]QSX34299.1 META domain-containing protein [Shewanella avicenniae]
MRKIAVVVALIGFISACQSSINEPQLANQLVGKWYLTAIKQQATLSYSTAYLTFAEDGQLSGNNSCNSFTGHYQLVDHQLQLTAEQGTRKACVDALMQQEQAFREVLPQVAQLHIKGDQLKLLDRHHQRLLKLERIN